MLIEHICPKAKEPVKGEIIGNGVMKKELGKQEKDCLENKSKSGKLLL